MADLRPTPSGPPGLFDPANQDAASLTQDSSIPTTPEGKILDLSFLDPADEPGDLGRIAHYRIQSVLGVGGMGVVFRAMDTHLRRTVALKVMRREYIESYTSRERFLQEARIVASLESDFLVTVYQVGMHKDVPFLAMQYLHGETLEGRLEREGKMPLPDSLIIARHVAAGLSAAHARGLVHRDIKPANVWLESDPNTKQFKRAKVLDFGLARVLDSTRKLTNMGIILGTPQFMSPEQTRGSLVDSRSDLFSLGSVLYTMLTGIVPFDAESAPALLVALISSEPPPVAALNPSIPAVVSDLVCRLMEKYPIARMQTADEVIEAIDAICAELSGIPLHRLTGTDPFAPLDPGHDPSGSTQMTRQSKTVPSFQIAPKTVPSFTIPNTPPPPKSAHDLTVTPPPALDVRDGLDARDGPVLMPTSPPPPHGPRRGWILKVGVVASVVMCAAMAALYAFQKPDSASGAVDTRDIRIGIVFAKTGSEASLMEATILAIDEINQRGGVHGRKVVGVEVDAGQGDESRWADQLFRDGGVVAVFGPGNSPDRRALRPYIERNNSLLFYPMPYEGMESSSRVVYTGPTAAQTLDPSVRHLLAKGARKVFYVGADDIQGHAEAALLHDLVRAQVGTSVVGEAFVALAETDFAKVLGTIRSAGPDVVVNGLTDSRAVRFTEQFKAATPAGKMLHLSYIEEYDSLLGNSSKTGDSVISYFAKGPNRAAFEQRFRTKYEKNRAVTDAIASAYTAVHLWAAAAAAAPSPAPNDVLTKLPNLAIGSPFGQVRVAGDTNHLEHRIFLGQFRADGELDPLHPFDPSEPVVYPPSRPAPEWDRFVKRTSSDWGNAWRAPKK